MQRSGIIDNIAQGILGKGDKEGTNAVSIKKVHVYTSRKLAYYTFFNDSEGAGGGKFL